MVLSGQQSEGRVPTGLEEQNMSMFKDINAGVIIALGALFLIGCAESTPEYSQLADESELRFAEYDVRFTNPECREYRYDEPVRSNGGDMLTAKPRNVYCKYGDAYRSGLREDSVQSKLISWIRDPETEEIWFHFLSFSNSTIGDELCDAVERGVDVEFVLDAGTDLSEARDLLACRGPGGSRATMHLRGREGGLGYAHNKLMMVNPHGSRVQIAFASANLSSGVVLHHENWHFITVPDETYFVRAHHCLHEGVVENGFSTSQYERFIASCRDEIPHTEESDVKVFLIPGEGDRANRYLFNAIERAENVRIAAHRFSYGRLMSELSDKLDRVNAGDVQLIVDDDLYWAGRGDQVGANNRSEANRVDRLRREGLAVRYMETNHDQRLLHHNKFLIMNDENDESAVFAGAGNLTNAGFYRNYENFYYVTVPAVVEAFNDQYDRMWEEMATDYWNLPAYDVTP